MKQDNFWKYKTKQFLVFCKSVIKNNINNGFIRLLKTLLIG